jgi:hypothetical protein
MLGDHDPAECVPNLVQATMPLLVNDVVAAFLRTARACSSVSLAVERRAGLGGSRLSRYSRAVTIRSEIPVPG